MESKTEFVVCKLCRRAWDLAGRVGIRFVMIFFTFSSKKSKINSTFLFFFSAAKMDQKPTTDATKGCFCHTARLFPWQTASVDTNPPAICHAYVFDLIRDISNFRSSRLRSKTGKEYRSMTGKWLRSKIGIFQKNWEIKKLFWIYLDINSCLSIR